MPIYEYQCRKCGQFETMRKISEPPLKRCPTCAGKVTKLMSNTSFQLKGSGWYVTDYARKDGTDKQTGEAAKPESGAAEAKPESKTETPAASKTGKSTETAAA